MWKLSIGQLGWLDDDVLSSIVPGPIDLQHLTEMTDGNGQLRLACVLNYRMSLFKGSLPHDTEVPPVGQFASCLITQRLFHAPRLWKRASGNLFADVTDNSHVCLIKNLPLFLQCTPCSSSAPEQMSEVAVMEERPDKTAEKYHHKF